jgi:hypothetical protein
MKTPSVLAYQSFFLVLAGMLSACALPGQGNSYNDAEHKEHHPQSGHMGMMDMKSLCEMHKTVMNAKTPAERERIMDEYMQSVSPEMRQRHIEMMQQTCR